MALRTWFAYSHVQTRRHAWGCGCAHGRGCGENCEHACNVFNPGFIRGGGGVEHSWGPSEVCLPVCVCVCVCVCVVWFRFQLGYLLCPGSLSASPDHGLLLRAVRQHHGHTSPDSVPELHSLNRKTAGMGRQCFFSSGGCFMLQHSISLSSFIDPKDPISRQVHRCTIHRPEFRRKFRLAARCEQTHAT